LCKREKVEAAVKERMTGALNGKSLSGCGLCASRLCRAVALVELGSAECTAVDEKAFELAGTLGERLAEYRRAALLRRALAGVAGTRPVYLPRDDPTMRRSRERCRVIRGGRRSGNRRKRRNEQDRSKHRY
jgi:hypothetical protein